MYTHKNQAIVDLPLPFSNCMFEALKSIIRYSLYIYISMPKMCIRKSRATVHVQVPFWNCMVDACIIRWCILFIFVCRRCTPIRIEPSSISRCHFQIVWLRLYNPTIRYSFIYISMPNMCIHKCRATVHVHLPFWIGMGWCVYNTLFFYLYSYVRDVRPEEWSHRRSPGASFKLYTWDSIVHNTLFLNIHSPTMCVKSRASVHVQVPFWNCMVDACKIRYSLFIFVCQRCTPIRIEPSSISRCHFQIVWLRLYNPWYVILSYTIVFQICASIRVEPPSHVQVPCFKFYGWCLYNTLSFYLYSLCQRCTPIKVEPSSISWCHFQIVCLRLYSP